MSVVVEFLAPVTAYPPGAVLADYPGVSVEVERIVPTGGSTHYVWIRGEGREDLVDELRADAAVDALVTVEERPDRALLRVEWASLEAPILGLVEDAGARLASVRGTHEGWTLGVCFPEQDALATFYETCHERGVPVRLRQVYGPDDATGDDEYGLTATQYETLARAFEAGYFDVPRGIDLVDLADELDVSEQAVSERLRRGLSSLLRATVCADRSDDSTDTDATD